MHFFLDDPPACVAKKALRVNLSDLAAKGAKPLGFLLTLALPEEIGEAWLASFARGLGEDADAYGCPLLGGDTDRTPGPVTISIAAFGAVPHGRMVRRGGAQAGRPRRRDRHDRRCRPWAAAAARRRDRERWGLDRGRRITSRTRYLLPQPRTAIADAVARIRIAAMDVSDGLAGDLDKLCRASGVAAEIEVARVPLSDAARAALARKPALIETILTGGDDYEVLATVPARKVAALAPAASAAGVAVTEIGTVTAGKGRRASSAGRQAARASRTRRSAISEPLVVRSPSAIKSREQGRAPCTTRPP